MKGQVAFEVLLVVLLIISFTIYISNLYLSTHDTTMAYVIIKDDLARQANSFDFLASIETIQLIKSDTENFYVTTNPNDLTEEDFNLITTKNKVEGSTKFENITITIN